MPFLRAGVRSGTVETVVVSKSCEDLVRCEGDSTPATLVSGDVRRNERILLKFQISLRGPKMCYTIDPATRPTRRHPL